MLDDDENVQRPKRGSHDNEEIARENRCGVTLQERRPSQISARLPGGSLRQIPCYCPGRDPNAHLSKSSLVIRSWPHSGFSLAIWRISVRSSLGIGGRPRRHFCRQSNLQPARCQRRRVSGCTTTKALRHSNHLASTAKLTRVTASKRRGRTPRSMNMANWRRRKRFSARTASVGRSSSTSQRRASSIRRTAIWASATMTSSCHSAWA